MIPIGRAHLRGLRRPGTKSTCTHHFKVLREAGVIRQRQEGTARPNTLRRDDRDTRFPGLLDSVLRASGEVDAV